MYWFAGREHGRGQHVCRGHDARHRRLPPRRPPHRRPQDPGPYHYNPFLYFYYHIIETTYCILVLCYRQDPGPDHYKLLHTYIASVKTRSGIRAIGSHKLHSRRWIAQVAFVPTRVAPTHERSDRRPPPRLRVRAAGARSHAPEYHR